VCAGKRGLYSSLGSYYPSGRNAIIPIFFFVRIALKKKTTGRVSRIYWTILNSFVRPEETGLKVEEVRSTRRWPGPAKVSDSGYASSLQRKGAISTRRTRWGGWGHPVRVQRSDGRCRHTCPGYGFLFPICTFFYNIQVFFRLVV
jgi:hypothetical protein